ncbi:MAG: hypothetical protein D3X82_00535 [Candidatus Leucobacter sulfamidivorax]|nr:hypothetical protein [Candidatus Leucobacter sulfamidivorax]
MSAAVRAQANSVDPAAGMPGWLPALRPALLVIIGLTVAFTAALHEQLGFDRAVLAVGLIAIGVLHLIEWFGARAQQSDPIPLLLGVVAILTGVLQALLSTELGFAVLIAAWALISGLLEFLAATFNGAGRGDHVFLGALGIVLALAVLLVLLDPVAVIGFFGAYAVIAGVYSGISFFDERSKRKRESEASDAAADEAATPSTN